VSAMRGEGFQHPDILKRGNLEKANAGGAILS